MRVRIKIALLVFLIAIGGYFSYKLTLKTISKKTGEYVEIRSNKLHVRDIGKGEPTVIIESGLGCIKESYLKLQLRTAVHSRVIAYDHSGVGKSTHNENPRTLPFYVEELRDLMQAKNLKPPYIFIGHSLGGHIIRYYAYLYPDEVAGLIFLDHPHEDWFNYIRNTWSEEENEAYFEKWNIDSTANTEQSKYEANCDSLRGKYIPDNIPVLMFTGYNHYHFRQEEEKSKEDMEIWIRLQASLIEHVKNAKHIVYWDAGHWPQNSKPIQVQLEINRFIKEIKKNYFGEK